MAKKKVEEKLETLFLHDKPARLLINIKNATKKKYASVLSKEVDCTYSHAVRLLQDMNKLGLVEFEKKGRIKLVSLTNFGEDIAFALENLIRTFSKSSGKK